METVTLPLAMNLLEGETLETLRRSLFLTPTDTIYGISAVLSHPRALHEIAAIKGRDTTQVIVLIAHPNDIDRVARPDASQRSILAKYWPAPITFILPGLERDTIAVRCPKDPFLTRLITALGEPIYSTSANRHDESAARSVEEARETFGSQIAVYIDGGAAPARPASTLVDLTCSPPSVIRQGAIPFT
ncbi:MAG: L-threonylcarbamoyladenylate synthase [Deltaproteobacteria bacterium]|nr:L-threonylcarbamoyladenylate synthase [Deltaproteobacteria bacterium]MBI3296372.1 L-threonylcarbamoyladenylate synthase [Deltaproteobacteria bacterium]